MKIELSMPSSRARSVIIRAKPSSVPSGLSASPSTAVASLPDSTTTPRISSSTLTRSEVSRNIVEPPKLMAWALTGSTVSSDRRPSSSASKTMFSVISLDIDAGGSGTSAFSSISTVPVLWSTT